MATDRADAICSPNGQTPINRWSVASWIWQASIPQASFVTDAHSDAQVSADKPSNRPHRFIDFPDEHWLRSVKFSDPRRTTVTPPIYIATLLRLVAREWPTGWACRPSGLIAPAAYRSRLRNEANFLCRIKVADLTRMPLVTSPFDGL
jgi:hypothetical protein